MLTSVRLQRFRAFVDTGVVRLSPLTCLTGANSSGKSSFLQALLVLKQTLAQRETEGSEGLALNGPFVSLGGPRDVVHGGRASGHIGLAVGFELRPAFEGFGRVGYSAVFDTLPSGFRLDSLKIYCGAGEQWEVPAWVLSSARPKAVGEALHQSLEERWGGQFMYWRVRALGDALPDVPDSGVIDWLLPSPDEPVALLMRGLAPAAGIREVSKAEKAERLLRPFVGERRGRGGQLGQGPVSLEAARLIANVIQAGDLPWSVGDLMRHMSPRKLRRLLKELPPKLAESSPAGRPTLMVGSLPDGLRPVVAGFEHTLGSLYHIGPLREEPRSFYGHSGFVDPLQVGQRGEATACVLARRWDKQSAGIHPPTDSRLLAVNGPDEGLGELVTEWIRYLGIADSVAVESQGKPGFRLLATSLGGGWRSDITGFGVGMSQVLPIVVQGLAAPTGSCLLIEQPELHLHPRVQSRVCDFLVAISKQGRQVVVETHSDHFINRIRLHAALGNLRDDRDVSLYFLSQKERAEGARVDRVRVSTAGGLSEWPDGFFDEYGRSVEEIVRAGVVGHRAGSETQ